MFAKYENVFCFSLFLLAFFGALHATADFSVDDEGSELITLRTKRQQCVCVVLNANQQLQCNCNNPNQPANPQQQQLNQQDLQQELGQVQSGQCGCVMIMINGLAGGQQPQYMCDCGTQGQPGQPQYNPQPGQTSQPGQPQTIRPTTTSTTTTTTTPSTTTTTTSALITTPAQPQFSNTGPSRGANPCSCICISVISGQSTYSCNCDGTNVNSIQRDQPQSLGSTTYAQTSLAPIVVPQQDQNVASQVNAGQSFLSSVLGQSNYFANVGNLQGAAVATTTTTQNPQVAYQQNTNLYTNNYIARDQPAAQQVYQEPATTTCITISVPYGSQACVCGENYVQCADNMCCHKRYRSMKEDAKSENAVDLIVDVIRNLKNKFMGRRA